MHEGGSPPGIPPATFHLSRSPGALGLGSSARRPRRPFGPAGIGREDDRTGRAARREAHGSQKSRGEPAAAVVEASVNVFRVPHSGKVCRGLSALRLKLNLGPAYRGARAIVRAGPRDGRRTARESRGGSRGGSAKASTFSESRSGKVCGARLSGSTKPRRHGAHPRARGADAGGAPGEDPCPRGPVRRCHVQRQLTVP